MIRTRSLTRVSRLLLVLVSVTAVSCSTLHEKPQEGLASSRAEEGTSGRIPNTTDTKTEAGENVGERHPPVNLEMAVLARGQLHQADLSRANLRRVTFSEGKALMARFKGADLAQAVLHNADFAFADFSAACLDGANLEGARLAGAVMAATSLRNANVAGADFRGVYLGDADLAGLKGWDTAAWKGANIINVKNSPEGFSAFVTSQGGGDEGGLLTSAPEATVGEERSANLAQAVLPRGQINGADLSGVCLRGFLLLEGRAHKTQFKGADLTRAWLDKTNFTGADFTGACLDSAEADAAIFASARFVNASMVAIGSEEGSIWANAVLDGADLEGARLRGSFMQGASLKNANVEGADFTDAYLSDADLEGLKGWEKATWRDTYLIGVKNAPEDFFAYVVKQNL